jgi:UbiD family decarboxylase
LRLAGGIGGPGCELHKSRSNVAGKVKHESIGGAHNSRVRSCRPNTLLNENFMKSSGNPLDLRPWLDEMRELGELKDILGADAKLELGAVSEVNVKKDKPAALLFDEIVGYPKGFRMLTCSTSSPVRLSSILRLGIEQSHQGLINKLRDKPGFWQSEAPKYDPVSADTGPVFENIQRGGDVNVLDFPAPLWHDQDGGRYIGTGCSVITRDLDNGWVNVGTYRIMVHDKNHVGLYMVPGKHGEMQYKKYVQAGKPFPVAIVLGADPLNYLISGIEIPFQLSEFNYIGAILQQPVSVVAGEITKLPFPSGAEIVLEGWVYPDEPQRIEGPFGEFLGYYGGEEGLAPVVTVERIYYRNNPIVLGSPPSKPPNDYSYSKAVMRSALLFNALVAAGVPNVQSVWAHEIGGARLFTVVSIKQGYAGHARQAGHILSQCGVGAYMSRYAIVVDEDIDPANLQEVMWAVATRTDPELDIDLIKRGMGSRSDPMFIAYAYNATLTSKAVIDACRPYDFIKDFPQVAEASKELRALVKEKWKDVL